MDESSDNLIVAIPSCPFEDCRAYITESTLLEHAYTHKNLIIMEVIFSQKVILDIADILMSMKWASREWVCLLVLKKKEGKEIPILLNIYSSLEQEVKKDDNSIEIGLFPRLYYIWLSTFESTPIFYTLTIKCPKRQIFWGFRSQPRKIIASKNRSLLLDAENVLCLPGELCDFTYDASHGILLAITIEENWKDEWKRDITEETFIPLF